MKALRNGIISCITTIVVFTGMYLFCHSTPERLIRTDLFFTGHLIGAFTTDVFKNGMDLQYGQFYSCKNPGIGPDHYAFFKKNGFWYINRNGTGGG
ncbi:hypothetical protein [Clostridium thailandense]|uniref:hypothetical protein n=1 Tax=Clostridium thailandense TaxID=2794346 RepID=UPI001FE99DAE|nr:hypothetical protein [Clostridium thailandense]